MSAILFVTDCNSKSVNNNNFSDPFQPGTSLYNIPQSGKSKKNKKVGRNRIYHDSKQLHVCDIGNLFGF